MGRTACTEAQCLYKGALYLTSVPVQGCTLPYLSACTRVHFTLPQCLYKGALAVNTAIHSVVFIYFCNMFQAQTIIFRLRYFKHKKVLYTIAL